MLIDNIKVGDRADITLKGNESNKKVYKCLVESKVNDVELDISVPISYGKLVILDTNSAYQILFFTESGFYLFDMSIDKYFKHDGFDMMRIKLTSKGEKKQRREFFRYKCSIPMKFAIVPDTPGTKNMTLNDGMILDLSGGGIMFSTNEKLHEGKMIKCAFMLDKQLIAVNAKILYKDDTELNKHKFLYRAQFIKIKLNDQERIIQYIFMQQRKKKGNIY